jgi:hypothetical protein
MKADIAAIDQDLREFLEVDAGDRRTLQAILGDNPIGQAAFLDLAYHVSKTYHIPESDLMRVDTSLVNITGAAYRIHANQGVAA